MRRSCMWAGCVCSRLEEQVVSHTAREAAHVRTARRLMSATGRRRRVGSPASARPASSGSGRGAGRERVPTLPSNTFRLGHVRQPVVDDESVVVRGCHVTARHCGSCCSVDGWLASWMCSRTVKASCSHPSVARTLNKKCEHSVYVPRFRFVGCVLCVFSLSLLHKLGRVQAQRLKRKARNDRQRMVDLMRQRHPAGVLNMDSPIATSACMCMCMYICMCIRLCVYVCLHDRSRVYTWTNAFRLLKPKRVCVVCFAAADTLAYSETAKLRRAKSQGVSMRTLNRAEMLHKKKSPRQIRGYDFIKHSSAPPCPHEQTGKVRTRAVFPPGRSRVSGCISSTLDEHRVNALRSVPQVFQGKGRAGSRTNTFTNLFEPLPPQPDNIARRTHIRNQLTQGRRFDIVSGSDLRHVPPTRPENKHVRLAHPSMTSKGFPLAR